jgi:hypothetical protein
MVFLFDNILVLHDSLLQQNMETVGANRSCREAKGGSGGVR